MKFLSSEVALYLYKSTIRPCMEYYCHVWTCASICYLELLNKLQKWNEGLFVLHFLPLWNPCFQLKSFCIGFTLIAVNLNWLNWFHFFILEEGLIFILIACMTCLLPFPYVTKMSMSTVSFLAQLNSGIICL